ncbi:ATP-binding protein [Crenothrix sp.]|uniref:ATP-binding protein n=1 Tax=Crenothrix sp. TaxID=3100433 RepID=UPI00374D9FE8
MESTNIQTFSNANGTQTWKDTVTVSNCDREQVQFSGAIMPHGVMLILAADDYSIIGASANAAAWVGGKLESLWGKNLDRVVNADIKRSIETGLTGITDSRPPRYVGCFPTLFSEEKFDVLVHRSADVFVIEFEGLPAETTHVSPTERLSEITDGIAALRAAETWQEGMAIAVRELKRMTGCGSVIGAYFLADGSGHAIAEACDAGFPPFFDKHFPRSDIPEPGRRQMLLMPIQYAPEHIYDPIPVIMATGTEQNAQPIDLSFSVLRSMSRMCSQYYLNINARSRLLLSLVNQGKLWGFFSCMGATPRRMCYSDRLAYQTFAETATLLFVEKAKAAQDKAALTAKRQIIEITSELSSSTLDALPTKLLNTLDITGAALCVDNRIMCSGITPPEAFIKTLMTWLDQQGDIFVTEQLPSVFESASAFPDQATGLIAARLREPEQYILGFRPEWPHEINWAGDPRKPVEVNAINGEERLTPRVSFELWKESVQGKARPWQGHEAEAITDLQRALILLQLLGKQKALALSLEKSNSELEAFAYIVSHDLQEPLRGILKSSYILRETAHDKLDEPEVKKLDTIVKSSTRMSDLIQAVLHYSRADKQALEMQNVDLNSLVESVLDELSNRITESGAQVNILKPLPHVICDPVATGAVFHNLIVNAIKYNDKHQKQIEIGHIENSPPSVFVKDNGIGIPESHQESVFGIFRRLHAADAYGRGTGAGLTIARKHIERQGGQLSLQSTPGEGSTFFFTFGE